MTVINAVVLVIADNIHAVIARIPLRRSRVVIAVVFPNQIVNTVFFRQGRIQLLPELLVNFCTALAPPEPRSRTIGIGVALCFVIRTENNRYASILYLFQFCCQGLNGQHDIFIFLCTLYNCLGGIEIGFIRLISAFLPVDCIAQFVICKILRNIDVPANRRNAVPFRTPFNDSFGCLVIPAIERVIVHIVKATDCRIIAEILLDVFKFGFIALQICTAVAVRAAFGVTAAIDFLLTREHMLSVNITEIIHQALCFRSCLRVAQRRGNAQFRQVCFLYGNRIISTITVLWQKLNFICAFFQAVNAKAEICPAISIRHLHHKF